MPGRLYVAESCGPCRALGRWIRERRPTALEVVPAESRPGDLEQLTYVSEGVEESGVAAFARALEHVDLGWAFFGFALRLPVVSALGRVLLDAAGDARIAACPASRSARRTSS